MKIYVIRHGETNYNTLSLCNDNPDIDVYLTNTGIQQAEGAAIKLQNVPIQKIFTSELPRTRQTAEYINQYHHIDIIPDSRLNDIRSGYEGRPVYEYYASISNDPLRTRPDNGESILEYKYRIHDFIQWLQEQTYNTVLIVAHEETIRAFYAYFRGISDEEMLSISARNCEIFEFDSNH